MRPHLASACFRLVAGVLVALATLEAPAVWALPPRGREPCTVVVTPPSPMSVSVSATASGPIGAPFSWTAPIRCGKKAYSQRRTRTYIWASLNANAIADATYGVLFPVTSVDGRTIANLYIRLTSVSPANPIDPTGQLPLMAIRQNSFTGIGTGTLELRGQFVVTAPVPSGPALQVSSLAFVNVLSSGSTRSNASTMDGGSIALPSGFTIIPPTCTVNSPVVSLPAIVKSRFAGNPTPGTTPFTVELTGCTAGTRLDISLAGASALADPALGVVSSTGSTNEVAVRVLDDQGQPVDISGTSFKPFTEQDGGTHLTIAYAAQYYALRQPVTQAGTVSAVLTFTLSYP